MEEMHISKQTHFHSTSPSIQKKREEYNEYRGEIRTIDMERQTTRKRQLASDLFSGFVCLCDSNHLKVSGICCKIVEHPFDTIKVLMQVNGSVHFEISLQPRKCIAIPLTV